MKRLNYRIYPTLLDSFNRYLAPNMYMSEDGPTEDELDASQFKDLIDKINRAPYIQTEPQAKGCAFESCINAMLDGEKMKVDTDKKGNRVVWFEGFSFNEGLLQKTQHELLFYSTRSERISAIIDTPVGPVELYGVLDYSFPSLQVDLKTTSKYDFLKFKDNTQHKAYPLIAKENGIEINEFIYLITDFRELYTESYTYSPVFKDELIGNICQFADFLETHRSLITDKKIFGDENPVTTTN